MSLLRWIFMSDDDDDLKNHHHFLFSFSKIFFSFHNNNDCFDKGYVVKYLWDGNKNGIKFWKLLQ